MLELICTVGEGLRLGDDIQIRILNVIERQVRVGIDAPKSINVVRAEIADQRRYTNRVPAPGVAPAASDQTRSQKPRISYLRRRHASNAVTDKV